MEFVSSDTNIWLDFLFISELEMPFRLPYEYIMYKEAMRSEIVDPPELLENLERLGLKGVELSTEEFFYADELSDKYRKLSGYDKTALAIAKKRKIVLITGDFELRKAAQKEGVIVKGTIGIIDELFNGGIITKDKYVECLTNLINDSERRLPEDELKKRMEAVLMIGE